MSVFVHPRKQRGMSCWVSILGLRAAAAWAGRSLGADARQACVAADELGGVDDAACPFCFNSSLPHVFSAEVHFAQIYLGLRGTVGGCCRVCKVHLVMTAECHIW
jgi:hypothetical protein